MIFHWNLSDSKSPLVSRILLSILAFLNNLVVLMVSTRPLISKSFSPINNPSVAVPWVPITIGINATFMFHSFFNSLAKPRYLSLFSFSFIFSLWSAGTVKSTILQVLCFVCLFVCLLITVNFSRLTEIKLSVCMSKSQRSLCISISSWNLTIRTNGISFVRMVKFQFLAQFPVDHLAYPVVSRLILILCEFTAFAYVIDRFVSFTT